METEREFLSQLVGHWQLTGKMGDIDLHQDVLARWILNETYLWVHCRSTAPEENPTAEYEAVYHIGYNTDQGLFVMHLLDTTEVPVDCVVGRGVLEDDRIVFRFDYEDTPFLYEFACDPQESRWDLLQTFEQEGLHKTFATKRLTKVFD